ncbi:TPA: DUF637 domain-containing protein [Vibrio parahaemolyticus]|uniref:DUF637 domain-containing protein n=2 Tax=Vibrio parahaemolyticus TaxID=670 RepID=UPI00193C9419|nr:DUF637 domain-containing protein [Vibrio parahaemolyticus]EGR2759221.1 hypothetical protein [Vibrio parahaemolyticus]EHA6959296.1 hypothetical protein [Vibrio parahaemolyticus]EHA6973480.1 hypothetical protein [Vibrio parahaemolyticus]MBM4909084.1 DUF637 domain-containing protein [Vibrio parahaemolyticus]MBM5095793.1 DUF637 domain-containing protein [Vibrio parahaemolyticus]
MKNKQDNLPDLPPPLWQKCTSYLLSFVMVGQIVLPGVANAAEVINDATITTNVNASPQFSRVYNRERQFEKAYYIASNQVETAQDVVSFHKTLLNDNKSGLPEPLMIPIAVGDITVIFPHYPVDKRIGDKFVQARLIRMQMQREIDRLILPKMSIYQSGSKNIDPRTEKEQINYLYQNAKSFAAKYSVKYGEKVTRQQVNAFKHDFIWPELRNINGEQVLVPVLHLTDATIDSAKIAGHTVEVSGDYANFRNITVNSGTLLTRRNAFLNATGNLSVSEHAKIIADEDLNLNVGGTLFNAGTVNADTGNANIITGQYVQKTMVHRFATKYEQGSRLGKISSVNAKNGTISISSASDIDIAGGQVTGKNITFNAGSNIFITSQQTTYVRNEQVNGFKEDESIVEHFGSKLTAEDSISLMASGQVVINASEVFADKGVLSILAQQGVHIANADNKFQSSRYGRFGKTTIQESEFQSIAIRSALSAGRNVMISSSMGDITLKATKIDSVDGTSVNAMLGKVNLLLAKEQDHYFFNKVKKGFWKIKTETKQDQVDTAVYNSITGGVKIHATQGVTLELGQKDGQTLDDVLSELGAAEDLSWMVDVYNDPQYSENIELVYQRLEELHIHEKTSNLSPAAMAIIAIAVSVAMGPAGAGWIGAGANSIGPAMGGLISAPAMQAGAVTLATSAATSLANGDGLDGAIEKIVSSEGLRSLAISMATAGILNSEAFQNSSFFNSADVASAMNANQTSINLIEQAQDALMRSVIRSSVSTLINGGDFGDFGDSLKQNMLVAAANSLGESMAQEIKGLAEDHNWSDAIRYIAHAGAGCVYGAALAEAQGGSTNSLSCSSGAGGAVVGEVIGDLSRKQVEENAKKQQAFLEDKIDKLKESAKSENSDLSAVDLVELDRQFVEEHKDQIEAELNELKAAGVDLAKLGAGLAAFAAGGDVDIAASAGENAAENNALFLLLIPILLKVIDAVTIAADFYEVADTYDKQGQAAGDAALQELLKGFAIDATVGQLVPGSRMMRKIAEKLNGMGLGEFMDRLEVMMLSRHNQLATAGGPENQSMAQMISSHEEILSNHLTSTGRVLDLDRFGPDDIGKLRAEYSRYVPNGKYVDEDLAYFIENNYSFDTVSKRFRKPATKKVDVTATPKGKPDNSRGIPKDLNAVLGDSKTPLGAVTQSVKIGGVEYKDLNIQELTKLRDEISVSTDLSPDIIQARKGMVSDAIGEIATTVEALSTLKKSRRLTTSLPGKQKSGEFDQVWVSEAPDGSVVIDIFEAKGGSSKLGSRLHNGKRVEQASGDYIQSIHENMVKKIAIAKKRGEDVSALQETVELMKDNKDNIRMKVVQQKYVGGSSTIRDNYVVKEYEVGALTLWNQ